MAEPVSRAAWSRLVALLNAYVSEGGNAFSHSGPSWKAENWSTENSGLDISQDWSFPHRISRGMVKSMFEWSTQADDMYRATCAAMVWAGERVANAPFLVKQVAVPGAAIGEEVLKLKLKPSQRGGATPRSAIHRLLTSADMPRDRATAPRSNLGRGPRHERLLGGSQGQVDHR